MVISSVRQSFSWWLVIAFSVLLAACASSPKKQANSSGKQAMPSWVTQPPTQAGMAYGVGSMELYGNPAEAVKRAAEFARADLVAQLKVTVQSSMSSETTASKGTNKTSEMQQSIRQYVQSNTPQAELDEVETIDTWLDNRFAYALVELDRNRAAARLNRELLDIEDDLSIIANIQPQGSALQQLQPLLPALQKFAQRERVAERLALVSIDRHNQPLPDDLKALEQRIYQGIDKLSVRLVLQDSGAKALRASLTEALTQQGLRLSNSEQADLIFTVQANISEQYKSKNYYSFINSQIMIEDGAGRVLNSFGKQAKGVSGMSDMAKQKAAQALADDLAAELAATLADKLR